MDSMYEMCQNIKFSFPKCFIYLQHANCNLLFNDKTGTRVILNLGAEFFSTLHPITSLRNNIGLLLVQ